jgi:hypothetical protein
MTLVVCLIPRSTGKTNNALSVYDLIQVHPSIRTPDSWAMNFTILVDDTMLITIMPTV